MAILDPSGINPGQLVQYIHVKNLYDALNGDGSYDIVVTGDFTVNSGAITGGTINATSFVGSGLSLTGVVTDTISASFATTASLNTFTGSYYTDSASFESRIIGNDNDITNLFVASGSLNTQQNALQAWSSSIVLDYLGDVQTVGSGFAPLNGNVLVYDSAISKFRPSRNSLTVNITGSTIFKGDTEVQGFLTADNALFSQAITASSNISSSATVQGLTGSFGRLEGLSPITVGDELILLKNITSSAYISSSLDVISRTGSFDYVEVSGNISGSGTTTLSVGGDITGGARGTFTGRITALSDLVTPKILNNTSANAGTVLIDDGLTVSGHLTASIISSSGDLSAVTGSFSHLTGNSPITVGSPTKFLQSVTASGAISSSNSVSANLINSVQGIDINGLHTIDYVAPNIRIKHTGLLVHGNGTAGHITASGAISASGDIQGGSLTSAGTITAGVGSFVITDNLRAHPGDVIAVLDNLNVTGNVTASQDISASGDLHGAGLIVEGTGRITGSLFVSGSSNSVDLIPEDRFLVDSDNITLSSSISFNISGSPVLDGNLTASGNISASGDVSGVTGSFSHLVGNSPITVGDPTEFLQPVTASIISASSAIIAPAVDMAITQGTSQDSNSYTVTGRRFIMRSQLQGPITNGNRYTFLIYNNDISPSASMTGNFIGDTTGSMAVGSIITCFPTGSGADAFVTIHNVSGETFPDDTPFTASFVVF